MFHFEPAADHPELNGYHRHSNHGQEHAFVHNLRGEHFICCVAQHPGCHAEHTPEHTRIEPAVNVLRVLAKACDVMEHDPVRGKKCGCRDVDNLLS
ncbi:hypothetical protein D3C78_1367810 [compost metagenome]